MTEQEIKDGNKLMAHYLGYLPNGSAYESSNDEFKIQKEEFRPDISWEWLMRVVEKIESSGVLEDFQINYHSDFGCSCKIILKQHNDLDTLIINDQNKMIAVYKVCLQYLEWDYCLPK